MHCFFKIPINTFAIGLANIIIEKFIFIFLPGYSFAHTNTPYLRDGCKLIVANVAATWL